VHWQGETALKALIADSEMKALAARTGGSAFFLDAVRDLDRRLSDLQELIRSRYLVPYKPSNLLRDGSYHPIALTASREGHKSHVYVRRGCYLRVPQLLERSKRNAQEAQLDEYSVTVVQGNRGLAD
jgi:hypothetical protein